MKTQVPKQLTVEGTPVIWLALSMIVMAYEIYQAWAEDE
jgi:hypothetical protein